MARQDRRTRTAHAARAGTQTAPYEPGASGSGAKLLAKQSAQAAANPVTRGMRKEVLLVLQQEAATDAPAGAHCRVQDRLTALRNFFAEMEPELPAIFALSHRRLFEVEPGLAGYFKGGVAEHLPLFIAKIQSIVRTTRSSQLWPAGAATGQMLIPEVAALGRVHTKLGVEPAYFSLMNDMLAWTCKEAAFEQFTLLVEEGLAFVFDVLGASLTAKAEGGDVLSKLQSRFGAPTLLHPAAYFDEMAEPGTSCNVQS